MSLRGSFYRRQDHSALAKVMRALDFPTLVSCGWLETTDCTAERHCVKVPIPILELKTNFIQTYPNTPLTLSQYKPGKLSFRSTVPWGPELGGRLEAGVRLLAGCSVNACRSLAPARNMRLKSRWQKAIVAHDYEREKCKRTRTRTRLTVWLLVV